MKTKDPYPQTVARKLKTWRAQIAQIKSHVDEVPAQLQIEFYRQIDLLDAKIELAEIKCKQWQEAKGVARDELKASLDGIFNEIENAIDSATAKIGLA